MKSQLPEGVNPLEMKLSEDIKELAKHLTREEVRAAVDAYYRMQKVRIGTGNTIGAIERIAEAEEKKPDPTHMLGWIHHAGTLIENRIVSVLDIWTDQFEIGRWMKSHVGIGPVISAGFIGHARVSAQRHFVAV